MPSSTVAKGSAVQRPSTGAQTGNCHSHSSCGSTKCKRQVSTQGIQCDACKAWYHRTCGQLKVKTFSLYSNQDELNWYCPTCISKLMISLRTELEAKQKSSTTEDKLPVSVMDNTSKEHSIVQAPVTVIPSVGLDNKVLTGTSLAHDSDSIQRNSSIENINAMKSLRVTADQIRSKSKDSNLLKGSVDQIVRLDSPISLGKDHEPIRLHSNGDLPEAKALLDLKTRLEIQEELVQSLAHKHSDLIGEISQLQQVMNYALGRHRNIVIHGVPEMFLQENRMRIVNLRHHLMNILRLAGLPSHASVKRIFRLGKWRGPAELPTLPRPVLVEFTNPTHRDGLLAMAELVKQQTNGSIRIEPDKFPKPRGSSSPYQHRGSNLQNSSWSPRRAACLEISRIDPVIRSQSHSLELKHQDCHPVHEMTWQDSSAEEKIATKSCTNSSSPVGKNGLNPRA
jgi:hypothetical protein